jgi:AraC-like DNA-binding protein
MSDLDLLRDVIGRHASNYHGPTALDGLTITATDTPTEPRPGVSEPSVAMVVHGRKRTVVGDGIFDYSAGEFLVVSLEIPVIGQVTEASPEAPFIGFGVRLDAAEVASLLLESADSHVRGGAGIAVARAGSGLLDAARHLVALLDAPEDAAILAPLYRRELLWRLLNGPHGRLVRQIGLADGNLADIARTVRWIRDHHREPIRVEQLADMASMSASSFHRHFRSVTCMTPIQYQKAIRLQEARLALLANRRDVAEVAHAVGYDSTSQFSREYRRLFGAPPGRDATRLRTAALQPVVVP